MAGPDRFRYPGCWVLLVCSLAGGCVLPQAGRREAIELELTLTRPVTGEVYFVSSLDQFTAHPARREDVSTWTWRVAGDQPFTYFFLVDGEVVLPDCGLTVQDDFGEKNCVYEPVL